MTVRRDPDRLIQTFIDEGAEQLDDRIYDAVRAEIDQRRQRAVVGPWRLPIMNRIIPLGLAAAALVVAVVVGTRLLAPPGTAGPGAGPTPSPTPAPSPSPASPSSSPDGLALGPSLLETQAGIGVSVSIPSAGWYGDATGGGILVKNENVDPPDGAGLIIFIGARDAPGWFVPGDPCDWDATMPATPASTVDELVAALAAQASREASAPEAISVDNYTGKSITLHVPDDAVFSDCDEDQFCSFGNPERVASEVCERYHQGPGQIDNLWILDVDGQVVIVDWTHYAETPPDVVEELRSIVESMTFA